MTTEQIQTAADRAMVKFRVAKQLRELIDQARKEYGPQEWDADDLDSEISELVFGD